MAILVKPDTKVLVQGITGSFGGRHTQLSLEYGSQLVAGVTPGKAGQKFEDQVPIFDSVKEAVQESGATASAIFVPPPFAADAILEAADVYMIKDDDVLDSAWSDELRILPVFSPMTGGGFAGARLTF